MKKIILIAAAALLAGFTAAAQDMEQATAAAKAANEAVMNGDYETALAGFRTALEQAEACGADGMDIIAACQDQIPRILLQMGKDQIKEKNYDAALEKVNEALEAAQEYENADVAGKAGALIPTIKMSKANDLLNAKDYGNAIAAFEEILASDPDNGQAALRLGMANYAAGNIDEAKTAFETAAANGQQKAAAKTLSNICLKQAQGYLKEGKYKETIAAAEESNSWLENANAYKLAASASTKAKDNEAAITYYEKYLEVAPTAKDAADINYTIAVLYQQQGNKAKAIEYYQKVVLDPKYGEGAKQQIATLNK